ncbi:MAG: alpha/beta hydrolase family protein [Chitinophagaceae bacterium]
MLSKAGVLLATLLVFLSSTAQMPSGYWEGQITYQGRSWRIAAEFVQDSINNQCAFFDFIEVGGYKRTFTCSQSGGRTHFERQQPGGRVPLIFESRIAADIIEGTFSGIGIKGASFQLKPARKFVFSSEDVLFQNDSVQLSGSLLIPAGEGPFEAVVITHGSGPDTRDLYYGIARQFLMENIAVLIYDKRGNGRSTGGDYQLAGFTDLAKDALAGLHKLKGHPRIHPGRIGVFGHSQGGWVAPTAAGISADVAFVIVSAASGVNATEQSVFHRANLMRKEGLDENVIAKASHLRKTLNAATALCAVDSQKAKELIASIAEELRVASKEPWFESSALPAIPFPGCPGKSVMELLFREPSEIWSKVKVPVYAVWGQYDDVVPVAKYEIIENALKKAGNRNVTIRIANDTDHSFLARTASGEWDFPRESKGYFSKMAVWIKNLYL